MALQKIDYLTYQALASLYILALALQFTMKINLLEHEPIPPIVIIFVTTLLVYIKAVSKVLQTLLFFSTLKTTIKLK